MYHWQVPKLQNQKGIEKNWTVFIPEIYFNLIFCEVAANLVCED